MLYMWNASSAWRAGHGLTVVRAVLLYFAALLQSLCWCPARIISSMAPKWQNSQPHVAYFCLWSVCRSLLELSPCAERSLGCSGHQEGHMWSLTLWSRESCGEVHVDLGCLDMNPKCQLLTMCVNLSMFLNPCHLPFPHLQDKEASGIYLEFWIRCDAWRPGPGHSLRRPKQLLLGT